MNVRVCEGAMRIGAASIGTEDVTTGSLVMRASRETEPVVKRPLRLTQMYCEGSLLITVRITPPDAPVKGSISAVIVGISGWLACVVPPPSTGICPFTVCG